MQKQQEQCDQPYEECNLRPAQQAEGDATPTQQEEGDVPPVYCPRICPWLFAVPFARSRRGRGLFIVDQAEVRLVDKN